jgi:hypothetical protein
MDIISIKSHHVYLVHHNEVPLAKLIAGTNPQALAKLFNFNQVQVIQEPLSTNAIGIQFSYGVFTNSSMQEIPIPNLQLEERRVLFDIEGPTTDGQEFYENLVDFFRDFNKISRQNYLVPIIRAVDSEIIAHINVDISKLIAPAYLQFIDNTVTPKVKNEFADAKVLPLSIAFQVMYNLHDNYLEEHRVNLSRKEFSIQPAVGHPVNEKIYFSKAPIDTQDHIALLKELETDLNR